MDCLLVLIFTIVVAWRLKYNKKSPEKFAFDWVLLKMWVIQSKNVIGQSENKTFLCLEIILEPFCLHRETFKTSGRVGQEK